MTGTVTSPHRATLGAGRDSIALCLILLVFLLKRVEPGRAAAH